MASAIKLVWNTVIIVEPSFGTTSVSLLSDGPLVDSTSRLRPRGASVEQLLSSSFVVSRL